MYVLAATSPRATTPEKICESKRLTSMEGGGGFLRDIESKHILMCRKSHRRERELVET